MPTYSLKNDLTLPWTQSRCIDGDLFADKFIDGWLVGRTKESEVIFKEDTNWPSIAAGNAAGPLQPDGTTAGALPDTPRTLTAEGGGREFLYIDRDFEIWQIYGSIDWPLSKIFMELPKGSKQGNLRTDLSTYALGASAISTWGWAYMGKDSMIGEATRIAMFLLPPAKVSVAFAVWNEASQAHTPRFEWIINKIQFEPLDPADNEDAKLICDVLRNRIDTVKYSPGLNGFIYTPGFRKQFGVDPIKQTKRGIYRVTVGQGEVLLGGV